MGKQNLVLKTRPGAPGGERKTAGKKHRPDIRKPDAKNRNPKRVGGGNARQRYQHYLALAEAAAKAGDRITSESYYQHADHFYRVMHGSDLAPA